MNRLATGLNILRAAVLGANDGIISIAGGGDRGGQPPNIWIIFYLAYLRFWQVPFRWQGGEYVSVSTQIGHGRSRCEPRISLVGSRSKLAKRLSLPRLSSNGNVKLPQRF